ncbi:hypothetical protein GJ496_005428 [Pomphorhynchus laevis]|nr:hypothetical protein GJ496_005428 [Pomphorhynchus laevis]
MPNLPISRFGRSLFDFDNFFGKSLDFFDPFDRWDLSLNPHHVNSVNWIREPPHLSDRPLNKFRVTLPATGYDKSDITTSISGNILTIHGRHSDHQDGNGYNAREFSRKFDLPRNIDESKMTSFLTGGGMLVVEMPFMVEQQSRLQQSQTTDMQLRSKSPSDFYRSDFLPHIVNDNNGLKKLEINVPLPNYQPDEIQLTLKDHDLILKAESTKSDNLKYGRQYLYRQVTLPKETNTNMLSSTLEDGTLHIEAPLLDSTTVIPIQK